VRSSGQPRAGLVTGVDAMDQRVSGHVQRGFDALERLTFDGPCGLNELSSPIIHHEQVTDTEVLVGSRTRDICHQHIERFAHCWTVEETTGAGGVGVRGGLALEMIGQQDRDEPLVAVGGHGASAFGAHAIGLPLKAAAHGRDAKVNFHHGAGLVGTVDDPFDEHPARVGGSDDFISLSHCVSLRLESELNTAKPSCDLQTTWTGAAKYPPFLRRSDVY